MNQKVCLKYKPIFKNQNESANYSIETWAIYLDVYFPKLTNKKENKYMYMLRFSVILIIRGCEKNKKTPPPPIPPKYSVILQHIAQNSNMDKNIETYIDIDK